MIFMKKPNKLEKIIFILLAIIASSFAGTRMWETPPRPALDLNSTPKEELQVIIYIKKNCSYCHLAEELLAKNNMPYEKIELGTNPELAQKLINQTGQVTVPYIFINDEFIGGYKNLVEWKNKQ